MGNGRVSYAGVIDEEILWYYYTNLIQSFEYCEYVS